MQSFTIAVLVAWNAATGQPIVHEWRSVTSPVQVEQFCLEARERLDVVGKAHRVAIAFQCASRVVTADHWIFKKDV